MTKESLKIGVIADTHGYLDPQVYQIFHDVEHIIHAGDIGTLDVLMSLQAIAPTTAVYGNVDGQEIRSRVQASEKMVLAGFQIEVTHIQRSSAHNHKGSTDREIRIYGHTHEPEMKRFGRLFIFNPGSASRPAEGKKPSVMILHLNTEKDPEAMVVFLD